MPSQYTVENPMVLEENLKNLEYQFCEHPKFIEAVEKYRQGNVDDLVKFLTNDEKLKAGIIKVKGQMEYYSPDREKWAPDFFPQKSNVNKLPHQLDPDNYAHDHEIRPFLQVR